MKKPQKLTFQPDYNFILIGISSHENDYKLSWALNKKFDFSFIRTESLLINDAKLQEHQSFAVYRFEDEIAGLLFNLISNRCENGFLLEELKNIDYFLQIYGEINTLMQNKFIADLKSIDVIIAALKIDHNNLSSKQKLIF